MKSMFNTENQKELLERLGALTFESQPQWGKMTPAQMLAHLTATYRMASGELNVRKSPLSLIGRLLKPMILGERPFSKNGPTAPEFVMSNPCEFDREYKIALDAFAKISDPSGVTVYHHPFFGPMTIEDWGNLMYKHTDHHLKQFGL